MQSGSFMCTPSSSLAPYEQGFVPGGYFVKLKTHTMITGKETVYPQVDTDLEFADVDNQKPWSRTYNHTEGLNLRQLFATNAQQAIVSNAQSLIEITKRVQKEDVKDKDDLFYKVVAGVAVAHADALIEALNK